MRYFQKHSTLITLIALFSLESCHQRKVSETTIITNSDALELRHIKEVLWPKAYREQDTVLLDKILDKSFELIDRDGNRFEKTDELNWIKSKAILSHVSGYKKVK